MAVHLVLHGSWVFAMLQRPFRSVSAPPGRRRPRRDAAFAAAFFASVIAVLSASLFVAQAQVRTTYGLGIHAPGHTSLH